MPEEPRLRLVVLHVNRAVKVDEEADARDYQQHDLAQLVELHTYRNLE